MRLFHCHALIYYHYVTLTRVCRKSVLIRLLSAYCVQHSISLRTTSDGILARILLQLRILNPMLPPSDV